VIEPTPMPERRFGLVGCGRIGGPGLRWPTCADRGGKTVWTAFAQSSVLPPDWVGALAS
jgi:hypothetical protein